MEMIDDANLLVDYVAWYSVLCGLCGEGRRLEAPEVHILNTEVQK